MTGGAFCGGCGARFSFEGRFCPQCGNPRAVEAPKASHEVEDSWPLWKGAAIFIAFFAIMGGLAAFAMTALSEATDPKPHPRPEDQLIARAEADVRQSLKDPASAQFDNMIPTVEADCVIGKVNARNGFGGFTGFQQFVWTRGRVIFEEGLDDQTFLEAFSTCMRGGIRPINGTQ